MLNKNFIYVYHFKTTHRIVHKTAPTLNNYIIKNYNMQGKKNV